MNRQEFEELELQVQQSELPLKSYLQQIGVSYSTYHYWRRKCSVDRSSIKHELAPISFKQAFASLPRKIAAWCCAAVSNGLSLPLQEQF